MYRVRGKNYQEDPVCKLGGGSEGQVFAFPDDPKLCAKIFHEPETGDVEGRKLAAYRARKVEAICKLAPSLHLPAQFIIPIEPTEDMRSRISGFLMPRICPGNEKIKRLLEMPFRNDFGFHLQKISFLFSLVMDDAGLLHQRGLTMGDVNMGFMLFDPKDVSKRFYADTDSYSYPGFPCVATTELFCHPDLYPNLTKAVGSLVVAQPHHDRFSILAMFLLMALHGAHPFRMGLHKKYRSLQERCSNGSTILDSDVTYPSFLPPREILSDDLLHEIVLRLKRQKEAPLPSGLLVAFSEELVDCSSCKIQFHKSRHDCPKCHERTLMQVASQVVEELFRTGGVVLFAQTTAGSLKIACRVNGRLELVTVNEQRQVNTIATNLQAIPGARYRFFDSYIVVCDSPNAEAPVDLQIYKVERHGIRPVHQTSSNGLENGSVVFETSGKFLYRTAGNTLMCGRFFNNYFMEQAVTTVHRSQTWFTVDRLSGADREVIFGYDRALKDHQWFIVSGNSEGEMFSYQNVSLPLRVREKLDDFSTYFNASSVLLVRKTTYSGKECVRYSVINLDGSVAKDIILRENDKGFDLWSQIHGKLFQSSSVLHLSSQGIVKQNLQDDSYITVPNSAIVVLDDRLLRFGKILAVARKDAILSVTPSK